LSKVTEPGSLVYVAHLLASAVVHHRASHGASSMLILEILLVGVGVLIGRLWGRRAGLKHLGGAEFRTRWTAVRNFRSF
jgi:hypothetical protein